jgi:hypothetical protein
MKLFRTAAVTAVAVTAAIATASAATAAPAPKFLSANQWPASATPWSAGPVKKGTPTDLCIGGVLPKASSKYRLFQTELDTGASQTVTVAASEAQAKQLVTKTRAAVETCLKRLQKKYPSLKGKTGYHGKVNVEEGAWVYSLDTHVPGAGSDIALYSIGRDGRTVTVQEWGQLGDLKHAPLTGFKNTTKTAVAKLY